MDPFALQQAARTRTSRLVLLAAVAIVATAVATGFVFLWACWGVWLWFGDADLARDAPTAGIAAFCGKYPSAVAACFLFSCLFLVVTTLSKFFALSSGDVLMESIGATRIRRGKVSSDADADLARDQLLNVCEEMSIASGLDMPSVWVLENEGGVNALAAGTDPSSAAVCVTRGALEWLSRDELQGVIAHEFSHILNGDMRLNFRLTALVCGITAVSRFGAGMLSLLGGNDDEERPRIIVVSRGRSKGKGVGPLPLLVIYVLTGIALWFVGMIGTFFARLVQCAVSREREFLADAASAQFTRNPEGLANALRLTYLADAAGCGRSFRVWQGDVSHMLFASVDSMLETHPPVKERIRRLSPRNEFAADESVKSRVAEMRAQRRARAKAANENFAKSVARAKGLKAAVASLADAKVQPAAFASVRSPAKAGGTLIALLRGQAPEGWVGALSAAERRTLALRCVNTLRDGVPASQRRFWASEAERVVQEDGMYDSFEMMVMASVRRRLLSDGRIPKMVPAKTLLPVAARVISTVASFGGDPESGYKAAERRLSLFGPGLPPMPEPYGDAEELLGALDSLVHLPPLAKRELLTGLKETIAQDGKVTDEEADYLAAVADAIGAYGWYGWRTGMS